MQFMVRQYCQVSYSILIELLKGGPAHNRTHSLFQLTYFSQQALYTDTPPNYSQDK